MTEHWSPINVWNRHRYDDHIESANHENDDNNASKLSGIINSSRQDKEQRSSSIDESSRARPQREPLQVLPNDFGSHILSPDHSLVQTSGFKNESEDMVSRVPPTATDLNKSNKGAPPGYQAEPALTHDEDIDFFGDSKVASNYSRSTLDQDSLHRGSITTLPSAGQRRGSAQQRNTRISDSFKAKNSHKSQDDHRSSFIDMAVATVATAGAAGAAAASGVTHAIMGSPTKEDNNEMPSSWPSSKESSSSNRETQTMESQSKQKNSNNQIEHHLRNQSEKRDDHGFCDRVHEPEIQGQNPSFYNHEKGRRWSEGWSHGKPADEKHTFSKGLLATSTAGASGGNLLGKNSSSKTGNLKLENITRESLRASQRGASGRNSSHNSSSKNFDYGRRVSENSRLHEDFSQTVDHAPSDDIKSYKGVLAAGATSNVSSSIPASRVQELPKETYYNSEDDDQYSNSGIPSTWGDQVLPIGQFSTDSETYEAQATHGYRGDEGINSVPQNVRRMSENQLRHLSQDHGYSNNQDPSYSNNQDHGLVDKFSSGTHSKKVTKAADLASLGGLGLGHQVHSKTRQENHIAHQDWLSNEEKNTISREETHHVPKSTDTGDRPPAQWSEINQNLEPKVWTKNDKSLPTGTGQDVKHENFIDHNLDINSTKESTGAHTGVGAGAGVGSLETKKEKTVITQEQKAFGNTQQAAFGGGSAFGSSGKVLVADDKPSASDKGYDSYDDEVKEQESSHMGIMGAAAAAVGGLFGFSSKDNRHDTESHRKDIKPTHITSQHDRNVATSPRSSDNNTRDGDIKSIGKDRYEENQNHVESSRDERYESVQHDNLKATSANRYKTAQYTKLHPNHVDSIQDETRPIGGNRYEMNGNDIVSTRDGRYESMQDDVRPISDGRYEKKENDITSTHDGRYETVQDEGLDSMGGDRYESNQDNMEYNKDGHVESIQDEMRPIGGNRYEKNDNDIESTRDGHYESMKDDIKPIGGGRYERNDNDIESNRYGRYETVQDEGLDSMGGDRYESNQGNMEYNKDGHVESIQDEMRPIGGNRYEKNDNDIESTRDGHYESMKDDIKPIGGGRYERNDNDIESNRYETVRGEPSNRVDSTRAISNNAESNGSALNQNNNHTGDMGKGAIDGVAATVGGTLGLNHKDKQQNKPHTTMSYGESNNNKVYDQTNNNNVYDEKGDYQDGAISRYDDDDLNINSRTQTNDDHGIRGDSYHKDSCRNDFYSNDSIRKDSYGDSPYNNNSYENEYRVSNDSADNHRSAKETIAGTAAGAAATVGGILGLNHKNKSSETDQRNISSYEREDPKRLAELPTQTDDIQNDRYVYKNPPHENTESRNVYTQNIQRDNIDQSNFGSQSKEHKSTVEAVAGALELDNGNKHSEKDTSSSTRQTESISSERNKEVPTIHRDSKSSAEKSHRNAEPSYGYDIRRDNDVNPKKSGKVAFSGTAAAAANALGLHNQRKSSQESSKPIPAERNKEVPGIPSEDTYQGRKSNDHSSRYHSIQGKHHGIDPSDDKDIIGGTAAGSSIGDSLALSNKNKQYSRDNQSQSNSGRRISAVPGIPSDTAQDNHSGKERTYKSTSYMPAQDSHSQTALDNERRSSRDSGRRGSIISNIIGGSHNKKYSDNDSGYDRSSKYQDATIYSGRTKSLPSVEQHDQDVRGSRFNNDHTSGADVRGSRYNSIQGDGDDQNRYGKGVIGGATTSIAAGSGEFHSHQQEPIYRQDRPVTNESFAKPVNKSKAYEVENIKTERKVSLPHIYRHGEPVRPEDAPNHGNNYESYEIENFKSDRLRNNSKSDKGIISTVGGMLGLNHDKDQDCRKSIDREQCATSNDQYYNSKFNNTNSKSHKGIVAGTVGGAGATAAAVGSVLGVNKSNESDNIQVNRDNISSAQGKRSSLFNQKFTTTENEVESNLTPSYQGTTQLNQGAPTGNINQETTQSNQHHFIGHANQEINTRQDQLIDGNQLDQSSGHQNSLKTAPTSSISNNSISSGQNNRESLYGHEAGGVAAVGGMFGVNSSVKSANATSPHPNMGTENPPSGQRNMRDENFSSQRFNSTESNTSGSQRKARTEAALAAAPHGNIYVSDRQYENAYSQGEDVNRYANNKSSKGAVAGTAAVAGAAVSSVGNKFGLHRKSNDATDQDHANYAQRQNTDYRGQADDRENKGVVGSAAETVGNKLGLTKSNELTESSNDTIHRGKANPMSGNNISNPVYVSQESKLTNQRLNQRQLPTPPKDAESISSTRATTGEIVPDVRNQEVKNRDNDNFQNGLNTVDEINNPKHRKNSISQGIKNKFNNAVRRLSSQGSEASNERRLSAAELYKNQQQATDHQQNALASGAAFGGGAAFGSAPSYQEQTIHQETNPANHHVSRPTNQHNEVIQENVHPAVAPQDNNMHPTPDPQETGIHSVVNNDSDNRQTTCTNQKSVRVPGVYTLKPAGEVNFVKVTPEDEPNAEGTVKAIIAPSENLSNQ